MGQDANNQISLSIGRLRGLHEIVHKWLRRDRREV